MTQRIPLFPLSQGLFPDGMLYLNIFEVRYLDLIKRCEREASPFGIVSLLQGHEVEVPQEVPQLQRVGTLAHVRNVLTVQPALLHVRCQGGLRFELIDHHQRGPFGVWYGQAEFLPADDPQTIPPALQSVADLLGRLIADGQQSESGLQQALPVFAPYRLDECGWVADRWAELLPVSAHRKQQLLAERDPLARLSQIARFIET